ncbi:hypothetical protein SBDP2_1130013 [Syntrophobacter sp. SbD2]|nr:hypothetical protein SBDP2_1130013 [Syntrophobacter sp. SbD2]
MTLESLGPDDFARAGFIEPFGRGAIGSDLGHYGYPPVFLVVKNSLLTGIFGTGANPASERAETKLWPLAPIVMAKALVYLGLDQESIN